MSVQRSADRGESYADFEFSNITIRTSTDSGGNDQDGDFEHDEDMDVGAAIPDDLAHDEVAELVALYSYSSLVNLSQSENVQTPGETLLEYAFGVNLETTDVPQRAGITTRFDGGAGNQDGIDTVNGTLDDIRGFYTVTDTPGLFFQTRLGNLEAFNDTVNGSGGGGFQMADRQAIHFREVYGMGPVLDQTDDLSFVVHMNVDDAGALIAGEHLHQCVWKVHEVEGRRPKLGLT